MNGDHPHLSDSCPAGWCFIEKDFELASADACMDLQHPDQTILVIQICKGDSGNIWNQIVTINQVVHAFLQTRVKCAIIHSG